MPRGTRIRANELVRRLATLDIDEGIRIEHARNKMFINRNASGVFIVQFGNDFKYIDSAKQVTSLIKSRFGSSCSAWIY